MLQFYFFFSSITEYLNVSSFQLTVFKNCHSTTSDLGGDITKWGPIVDNEKNYLICWYAWPSGCCDLLHPIRQVPKVTGGGAYHVLTIRKHNYQLGIMVPYHPPEILDGMEKRMLGDDEFIALIVTLRNQKKDRVWHMTLNVPNMCLS